MYKFKEDEADKWLRENDSYYRSNKKNKKAVEAYPYETRCQEHYRNKKEIVFSSMSKKQVTKLCFMGIDSITIAS